MTSFYILHATFYSVCEPNFLDGVGVADAVAPHADVVATLDEAVMVEAVDAFVVRADAVVVADGVVENWR